MNSRDLRRGLEPFLGDYRFFDRFGTLCLLKNIVLQTMSRLLTNLGFLVLGGVIVAGATFAYSRYTDPLPSVKADTCLLEECITGSVTYPIDELEDKERITLIELALEQQRLEALTRAMVERFGSTMQPFAGIARIEQRKTAELNSLFDKYNVPEAKANGGQIGAMLATSTVAGCVQVLDQERHWLERLYTERDSFAMRPDIRRFMQATAKMTRDTLMPALERCAKQQ